MARIWDYADSDRIFAMVSQCHSSGLNQGSNKGEGRISGAFWCRILGMVRLFAGTGRDRIANVPVVAIQNYLGHYDNSQFFRHGNAVAHFLADESPCILFFIGE